MVKGTIATATSNASVTLPAKTPQKNENAAIDFSEATKKSPAALMRKKDRERQKLSDEKF